MNIKPLGDRVLIEAIEQKEVIKGGIVIPDSAKEKPQEAVVVAVGPGKRDDKGMGIVRESPSYASGLNHLEPSSPAHERHSFLLFPEAEGSNT